LALKRLGCLDDWMNKERINYRKLGMIGQWPNSAKK
jgi:hypothetical protein